MNSEKLSMSFEVCPEDSEGPTEWFPAVSKADALMIVNRAIESASGHLSKLQRMRALIEATPDKNDEVQELRAKDQGA